MNATQDFAPGNDPSAAGRSDTRTLSRPGAGRMVGGVAEGLARGAGVDPILVRLLFVALTLMGGAGVPLYLAGWLLIPDETTGTSLASQAARAMSARRS
jgi:phage shock protein PspC (stress-responsive transcriptional regulator)